MLRRSVCIGLLFLLLPFSLASGYCNVRPERLLQTRNCEVCANDVAHALNTKSFLHSMATKKGGADFAFETEPLESRRKKIKEQLATSVEYKARLWFMAAQTQEGGMKFKETVRITNVGDGGKSATLQCDSKYWDGKNWVHCSSVSCQFRNVRQSEDNNIEMEVRSEVLVNIPYMPKFAVTGVQRKISSVFQQAARSYLETNADL
mmetsp:Transcript_31495/g.48222  ORF Transcript_31495/g.48222 Transcript_31495/m.48222 type:complete len:205 (+) Transcript_31495:157-771(+)